MRNLMRKYVKYDGMWREYDENTPLDCATLHSVISFGKQSACDIRNYEIVETDDYKKLDWYGTKVYDDSYKTGWLAPNGTFYGCEYYLHIAQADIIHNMSERQIEEAGFIKLSLEHNNKEKLVALFPWQFDKRQLTPKQYDYLKRESYIINFEDVEEVRVYVIKKSTQQNNENNNDDNENTPTF